MKKKKKGMSGGSRHGMVVSFYIFCLSMLHYPISSSRRKVQSFPRLGILFVDFMKVRVLVFSFFLFFFLSTVFVGFCMLLLLLTV